MSFTKLIESMSIVDKKHNWGGLGELYGDVNVILVENLDGAGVSVIGGIYINKHINMLLPNKLIYFVLLHELYHYKYINKIGGDKLLERLSNDDYDSLCDYIYKEENMANKYAYIMYYHLNKFRFDNHIVVENKNVEKFANLIYRKINNKITNYNKLVEEWKK